MHNNMHSGGRGTLPNSLTISNDRMTFVSTINRNERNFNYRSICWFIPTLKTASAPWRSHRMWDLGTGDKETFELLLTRFCFWFGGMMQTAVKGLYHIMIENILSSNSQHQSGQQSSHHYNEIYSYNCHLLNSKNSSRQHRNDCSSFQSYHKKKSVAAAPKKLKPKRINIEQLLKYIPYDWIDPLTYIHRTSAVLSPIKSSLSEIRKLFITTSQYQLKINYIERVENPFLFLMYQMKKEELFVLYGKKNVIEYFWFHGTKKKNIKSICTNNFDWRKYGSNKGHLFGKGVYFSPSASYASHYTNESESGPNQMILASILVVRTCDGNKCTEIPYPSCDTTMKQDGSVFVKYHDSTFYPRYLITYTGTLNSRQQSKC